MSRRGAGLAGSCPAPTRTLSGGPLCHDCPSRDAAPRGTTLPLAGRHDIAGFRGARLAVTAVGLGRRTTTNQNAFHRIDSNLTARAGSATLVIHMRSSAPHPVACREPILPRQRPAARFRLSLRSRHVPRLPEDRAGGSEKDASLRLLQPTSPHEHPADCSIPGSMSMLFVASRLAALHASRSNMPARPRPKTRRYRGWVPPRRLPDEPTRWSFA